MKTAIITAACFTLLFVSIPIGVAALVKPTLPYQATGEYGEKWVDTDGDGLTDSFMGGKVDADGVWQPMTTYATKDNNRNTFPKGTK